MSTQNDTANEELSKNFLGIPNCDPKKAKVSIIPAGLEKTTSYQKGTKLAPEELIEASLNIEHYDIETDANPSTIGIFNHPPLNFDAHSLEASLDLIEKAVSAETEAGRFPLVLGGEHSLSFAVMRALTRKYKDIGVIHFDAHADLRDSYGNTLYSHACAMRRIRSLSKKTLSIGIRSLSEEEALYIKAEKPATIYAESFVNEKKAFALFKNKLQKLPQKIFITFDIDVFDPSFIPHTGTPEPGGLSWYQCLFILKEVFKKKTVVGADIVELMPRPGSEASNFAIALLAYKMIAYLKAFGLKKSSKR